MARGGGSADVADGARPSLRSKSSCMRIAVIGLSAPVTSEWFSTTVQIRMPGNILRQKLLSFSWIGFALFRADHIHLPLQSLGPEMPPCDVETRLGTRIATGAKLIGAVIEPARGKFA